MTPWRGPDPFFGNEVLVTRATKAFEADGKLTDEAARKQLQEFMTLFGAFVAVNRRVI